MSEVCLTVAGPLWLALDPEISTGRRVDRRGEGRTEGSGCRL